jgi:hypothetical protein
MPYIGAALFASTALPTCHFGFTAIANAKSNESFMKIKKAWRVAFVYMNDVLTGVFRDVGE